MTSERAVPVVSTIPIFHPPQVSRAVQANGLRTMIVPRRGLPVFDVWLLACGGASLDSVPQAGRASLTAEMLDEGTHQRSALEISAQVELLGAELDLRAGWDACVFSLHGLTSKFNEILDLLAEVALQPSFPDAEFDRKQEERVHALLQERDEPRTVAVKRLNRAVFGPALPFGWPLGGTIETIQALAVTDLRACYQATFAPPSSHVLLVGELDQDRAMEAVQKRFGGWQSSALPESHLVEPPRAARTIHLVDRPGAAQSEVRIGHVGLPRRTPDYFPLVVMNTILGGSFKSRLNMILREEKGFTYGASSSFSFRRQVGLFSGGAAVHTDATAETVATFVREIERMRTEPVREEELARTRNYLSLGFMRTFETSNHIASHLADLALHDLSADYLSSYADRVADVSRNDVQRVARQHLDPDHLAIVVVGDRARVVESLQRLQLGPVLLVEAA
jgi:zinc protease